MNNIVDHYPPYKYENNGYFGVLNNNEDRLVACNTKLIDTKRDDR